MDTIKKVLVLNAGSSSLKFSLINPQTGEKSLSGQAERLGLNGANLELSQNNQQGDKQRIELPENADLETALRALLEQLETHSFQAIGHRAVHGGERFTQTQRIDRAFLQDFEQLQALAPLHNPRNLAGMQAALALWPQRPQYAVFDTAFHHTLPEKAYRYALPEALYREHAIRRYGFHGLSHHYLARSLTQYVEPEQCRRVITAHLGNGCSLAAVLAGQSVDTSMGFTPLEGLVMGTRSGDVDPGILLYLLREGGHSVDSLERLLNRESGLLGLSGVSSDYREVHQAAEAGDSQAQRALEIFAYRIARQIASLSVPLGGLDALVFSGGIGENAPALRADVVSQLKHLGLKLDPERNHQARAQARAVHCAQAQDVQIWVIPTQEDRVIAQEVMEACT